MRADLRRALSFALCAATTAGLAYSAFAIVRVRSFTHRSPERAEDTPHVTILKPLYGATAELAENLRSFCEQDYPAYDVVLGARDPRDASLAVAREIAGAYPDRVRVATGDDATPQYANPKASTLAALPPFARGEILIIADGDIRVGRDYLRAVTAPFADPAVGAVTCLYRGRAAGEALASPVAALASRLGALANHEHFAPSVLVATALGPLRWCFGATMAVRRSTFDAIGGLAAIGAHLADDARLGELVVARGERVALSRYVVENVVDEPSLQALFRHDLRWARTHRAVAGASYAGLALTYPLPLALLHLAFARRRSRALAAVAAAAMLRLALGAAARDAFGAPARASLLLAALSDTQRLAAWAWAFLARRVDWSGASLAVAPDGRVSPSASATPVTILVPAGPEALAVRLGAGGRVRVVPIRPGAVSRHLRVGPDERVVVMGLCGALDPSLHVGDVVLYRSVTDGVTRFTDSGATMNGSSSMARTAGVEKVVAAYTSEHVVTSVDERRALAAHSGAAVVDMESASLAASLAALGVKAATVRVVSDDALHDLPPLAAAIGSGRIDAQVVAAAFLRNPRAALAFARHALVALAVLTRTARAIAAGTLSPTPAPPSSR